jgi:hypothetical protein
LNHLADLIQAVQQGDAERVGAILDADNALANGRDESGAGAIHYAALNGHRDIVRLLIHRGAGVNSPDGEFGAMPTAWAIEFLRQLDGYLAIEPDDLAYAIQQGDTRWVARFLARFPKLLQARDVQGRPFEQHARESGIPEIAELFDGVEP